MEQEIKDLITAIVDENSVEADKVFGNLMADRLSGMIDAHRQEVANTYFNPQAAEINTDEVVTDETE